MDLGLTGRTAFLFGAGRGIGAATALVLAAEGARPALFARTKAGLRATAQAIEAEGGSAPFHTVDLTDAASTETVIDGAIKAAGVPDLALLSAGAAKGGTFADLDDDVWADAMALKFMGTMRVLRALAPRMKARGSGRIVVVVGNSGRQPHPMMLPGSAANAACLALVRGLAEELAPHGVTLNALNPGPTRTDRWDTMIARLAAGSGRPTDEVEAEQLARMPKGRIGTADEMARLAVMLMSDAADMVTGTSLTADGGATKALA